MSRPPLSPRPRRVLVIGSGPLQIGQAGEFDYSGTQALKALQEEGVQTVLVNPNIATIQTSEGLADRIYLNAVTPDFVEEIIIREKVDAVLLSFGGQTALNCGLELWDRRIFQQHGVRVLGTPIDVIRKTEDRELFNNALNEIGVRTPRSRSCSNIDEARIAAAEIGFPVMVRGGYALGGKGSSIVETSDRLDEALRRAFSGGIRQVLVEECLRGWKEIEYEVVRDGNDNCIAVCNMENMDPLGIHTGDSIVVAPSQTLNDEEYQLLRGLALRTIRHLGIIGECNIQYALDPESLEYRVIEVNARLSRSSALASKATGYPLAYVAAKIALGYSLPEIPNKVTRCTTAFFEPAMDYMVCKFPRWDLSKFQGASLEISSEMKSVGEVMAIGRTFPEAIQKAIRMLDIGFDGLEPIGFDPARGVGSLAIATPNRIFSIAGALDRGVSVEDICEATRIDPWFIHGLSEIIAMRHRLVALAGSPEATTLRDAKRLGYSDRCIERLCQLSKGEARRLRRLHGIRPHLAQIDTTAAEFPAQTNYLYSTYHAKAGDLAPSSERKIMVLGSGAYRIGSSVEFDWCAVNAIKAASSLGFETIMVNYNPETVSTDFDICNRLIFDEISFESVLDIYELEQPYGVIVSMGGQIPNNLALRLRREGVRILGTDARNIDRAEDRSKFSTLLDELGIDQPRWSLMEDMDRADDIVAELGGYPVLVRPSYVLSGAAMSVAHEVNELQRILERAKEVSPAHPVVVSKFETHAREIEIDAVADQGELVLWSICEHIEDAGVHSGDATLVLPPQKLYISTIRRIRQISEQIAGELQITGPFNIQFLAKHNVVKVIECNLRASRSFPFVSKVTGQNYAAEATRRMLGVRNPVRNDSLDLDVVGVKVPMFSFARLAGADPMLGVEMASTGEVGCISEGLHEALLHGLLATGFRLPTRGVLLSLGPWEDKFWFTEEARVLADELKLPLFATVGTARMLRDIGVACRVVEKTGEGPRSALSVIDSGEVDLVINVPREYDDLGRPDGYQIRRRAIDAGVGLVTDRQLARALVDALRWLKNGSLQVRPWNEQVRAQMARSRPVPVRQQSKGFG